MGYFESLTNGYFKKDLSGNTIFFPWGVLGTHLGVRAPCGQHVRAPRVKNDLISCSWLHLLKVWSLLKTRGDS